MNPNPKTAALRVSLIYALAAGLWILFSDRLLAVFITDQAELARLEIFKGWSFVTLTAVLLFFIVRRQMGANRDSLRQLKHAEALANLQRETLEMIAGGKPPHVTFDRLLRGLEALSSDMICSILLLEGTQLRHGAAPSLPEVYCKAIDGTAIGPKAGSCGTAAFRGSPVFVNDIARDPLWTDYKHLALQHGLRSCWSTPILDEQKRVLGTFAIYHKTVGMPAEADVRAIELVTHTAATAILKERAEKTLRESEERFRTLVDRASDAIFVHDANGRLLDANRSACESLGYSREELLRLSVSDIDANFSRAKAEEIHRELRPGNARILRGQHRRKDGATFPVEVSLNCYEIGGQRFLAGMARNLSGRKEYEDQLAQSVSLLRATVESSASGLLVVDPHGKVTLYNQRFLELWRIPAEAAAQGTDENLLKLALEQVEQPEAFLQRVQELYRNPERESFDQVRLKDGRVFERFSQPQRRENKIIGRVWSFLDVTERIKSGEALNQERELLRLLESNTSDLIYFKDLQGRFIRVNEALANMAKLSVADMVGKTDADLFSGEFAGQTLSEEREIIRTGVSKVGYEERGSWKDGRITWVSSSKGCLRDANGRIIGIYGVSRDITKQKEAELALRENARRLQTVFDLAPDFIFVKDTESRYLAVNHALAKLYRRQPAEMIGHTDADYVPAPMAARFRQSEVEVLGSPAPRTYEDTLEFPDGQTRTVVTNMVAFHNDDGKVGGLIGVGHDMTAQRQTESFVRLQSLALNTADNAVMITNPQGQIEWANPAFSRNTGYSLAECLGKNPRELLRSGQHRPEFYRQMWQTILAGQAWHGELTNRRKDGSLFEEEMTITPLRDEAGRITHFIAIKQDVTERRRTFEKLRQADTRAQFFMNRLPLGFIAWNQDFQVTEWNSAAEKIFGWTAAEALGRHAFELIVPTDVQPLVMKVWQEVVGSGNLSSHSVNENVTKDGRRLTCEWRNLPLRDTQGQITGCLSVVDDVTDRRQAEDKISRERARFKFIFESVPIGISLYVTRPEGTTVHTVNAAHLRNSGLTEEQNRQPNVHRRITHPEDLVRQEQLMEQVKAGKTWHFTMEKRFVHADGKIVWVDFFYQREVFPDGTLQEMVATVDITDRKRLEEQFRQSQKMEAIGQLSGGIAHDFNNILTVIQGNAALLQNLDLEPTETRDCSHQIARAAERAAALTRQLLMFARKQQMQPVNLDLNESVAQMTKMLQRILGEDVTLRTEYAPALPLIRADAGMIEQILLNLAVNARDAMAGGGKLTLRTGADKRRQDTGAEENLACLQVVDSGCGIAPEILPRIFEPFFTTKEVGKGTGLGLATVYGIVQQHHGEISVQSEIGKGTTFTLRFPALAETDAIRATAAAKPVLPWGTETILLVEDELPLRVFVGELLRRCGYTVLEAGSGPAALKVWEANREKIALLFTDVIMPEDMSGLELAQRLLADKPGLKVVYTSGYTGNLEGRPTALVEGGNFIRKPYKPEALASFIRNSLDGKISGT